ncbi:uncharacterized protein LOC129730643 [Wyeomyia smithii]|uniref:uncharacterized protein LOC129730643 n=1 Tax=Wyeomyia smithii TaxID=174621 RepID=UPI002467B636|nr:uncharacterized protein LOC129730643 [Wyeomyia smithii]
MKILAILLFVTVVSADLSTTRQDSLNALEKLRATIPNFQYAQDTAILKISEAKQKASDALNSFYHKVFEEKTKSLQIILDEEQETLAYGESVHPWCWDNNAFMLEGIMGWTGNDFSDCIKILDESLNSVIAKIYGRFQTDETEINKYSLLEVFKQRNIISNPQSIIDAIGTLQYDINSSVPEFDNVLVDFQTELESKKSIYSACLNNKLESRKQLIDSIKAETERCLANM